MVATTIRQWIMVILALLPLSMAAAAEIYRTVDADGHAVFTDQKPASGHGDTLELGPLLTIPAPVVQPSAPKTPKPMANPYTRVTITTPTDQATFHNVDHMTVTVQAEPALKPGDRFQLLWDGKLIEQGTGLSFTIPQPERGEHTIRVKIVNKSGQVVISSPKRTVFVHRASRLLRKSSGLNSDGDGSTTEP